MTCVQSGFICYFAALSEYSEGLILYESPVKENLTTNNAPVICIHAPPTHTHAPTNGPGMAGLMSGVIMF